MTVTINGMECRNPWEEAIARAGGPTPLAKAIGLTYTRVQQIRDYENGLTDRASVAKRVEDATGVPATELLGLVPWHPQRHGSEPTRTKTLREAQAGATGQPMPARAVGGGAQARLRTPKARRKRYLSSRRNTNSVPAWERRAVNE